MQLSAFGKWNGSNAVERGFILLQGLLAVISYVATTWGLADLMEINILDDKAGAGTWLKAALITAISTGVMLAMLTGLHAMLSRDRNLSGRLTGALAYFFFAFWSVAFGYGFFWKTFSAEDYTRADFMTRSSTITIAVDETIASLETMEQTVRRAADFAQKRSDQERTSGGTCENNRNSQPGNGPLTKSRAAFAERAQEVADDVSVQWITPLRTDADKIRLMLEVLDPNTSAHAQALYPPSAPPAIEAPASESDADAVESRPDAATLEFQTKLHELALAAAGDDSGKRTEAYGIVLADANRFVSSAKVGKDQIGGRAIRELNALHDDVTVKGPTRKDNEFCLDTDLALDMEGAATVIKSLEPPPAIAFKSTEGTAATKHAVLKLGRNALNALSGLVERVTSKTLLKSDVEPLNNEDWIAVFATVAVDFALLIVTLLGRKPVDRKKSFFSIWLRKLMFWLPPNIENDEYEKKIRTDATVSAIDTDTVMTEKITDAENRKAKAKRAQRRAAIQSEIEDLKVEKEHKQLIAQRDALAEDEPLSFDRLDLIDEDRQKVKAHLIKTMQSEDLVETFIRRSVDLVERIDGAYYIGVERRGSRQAKRFIGFLASEKSFGLRDVHRSDPAYQKVLAQLQKNPRRSPGETEIDVYEISNRLALVFLLSPQDDGLEPPPAFEHQARAGADDGDPGRWTDPDDAPQAGEPDQDASTGARMEEEPFTEDGTQFEFDADDEIFSGAGSENDDANPFAKASGIDHGLSWNDSPFGASTTLPDPVDTGSSWVDSDADAHATSPFNLDSSNPFKWHVLDDEALTPNEEEDLDTQPLPGLFNDDVLEETPARQPRQEAPPTVETSPNVDEVGASGDPEADEAKPRGLGWLNPFSGKKQATVKGKEKKVKPTTQKRGMFRRLMGTLLGDKEQSAKSAGDASDVQQRRDGEGMM